MEHTIIEKHNKKYIYYDTANAPINAARDGLDLIGLCMETDTWLLLIDGAVLSEDFFRLRTGVAGEILQKFMNYHVKAAVVMQDVQKVQGKFQELLAELNQGSDFRVFEMREEAEDWLLG